MSRELVGVSIIVPTFEQNELFVRCIQSLLSQSYKNFEIIVVDDNINKDYSDFIKDYTSSLKNTNITYVRNKENLGSSESRNVGVSLAKNEFVSFLDDDDFYLPNKIEFQLKSIIETNSLYSVCNVTLMHPNGLKDIRNRNFLRSEGNLLSKHLKFHITATSTFMFNKDFFNQIGGFPKTDLGDEFILMLNAIQVSDKFSHCDFMGVVADVNGEVGLSSYQNKITSENQLITLKYSYFHLLSKKDIRYIRMRHFLVKANAKFKLNMKKEGFTLTLRSFYSHPKGFLNIILGRDR